MKKVYVFYNGEVINLDNFASCIKELGIDIHLLDEKHEVIMHNAYSHYIHNEKVSFVVLNEINNVIGNFHLGLKYLKTSENYDLVYFLIKKYI